MALTCRTALIGIAAAIATAAAPCAVAALGGTEASVSADQARMHGTLKSTKGSHFVVHELEGASRAVVREYVAPTGVVFAVAWQGPSKPDLRQLLGPHFEPYVDALARRRTRRSPVTVTLPGLVVQSGGHMRAFFGKAWLPSELPAGVTPGDIR